MKSIFKPGRNIAMKIPAHEYDQTIAFYRNILSLQELTPSPPGNEEAPRFEFGGKVLWLDRVEGLSQAEIWLEMITDNIDEAAALFAQQGCIRCDEIEPLPKDLKAFWIASPSNIIHLITETDAI